MRISENLPGSSFLITWRIARRFGWRGLAVVAGIAAVIGPPWENGCNFPMAVTI